jgi:hypothetical protein
MSDATKPVVLSKKMVRTLERLAELREQRISIIRQLRNLARLRRQKKSIEREIEGLKEEIAPTLEPWMVLFIGVGLFRVSMEFSGDGGKKKTLMMDNHKNHWNSNDNVVEFALDEWQFSLSYEEDDDDINADMDEDDDEDDGINADINEDTDEDTDEDEEIDNRVSAV